MSGARSGNLDQVLARLAQVFSEDANMRMGRIIDSVEPVLAGFLTVSVGITLLAVMLPLIGILTPSDKGRGDVSGKTAAARQNGWAQPCGSMYTAAVAGCMGCLERRTGGNEGTGGAEPPHGGAGCGGAVLRS
ncbi:MAG: type II secretion system F family protein [Ruthenibacterium lactatiformans]